MFVSYLQLFDFRSYEYAEIEMAPGVQIFVGANGQGKTNLVEAVEYLARGASHRVATVRPLISSNAKTAVIRARVTAGVDDPRQISIDLELNDGKANRAKLNGAAVRRAREIVGALRVVLFSPNDLAIVKGEPADRRAFLDSLVITRWPRMSLVKSDYDRAVKQKTALLKSLEGRLTGDAEAMLEVWDESLIAAGSELLAARLDTLNDMFPLVKQIYSEIAPVRHEASVNYETSLDLPDSTAPADLAEALRERLAFRRRVELARGQCVVGPHRDDLSLQIRGLPAKGYASHGESWSLALALRLAGFRLLLNDGVSPVLILDDVFAELDAERRVRLAEAIGDAEQVLVTAAVAEDLPPTLSGKRYLVRDNTVTAVADVESA